MSSKFSGSWSCRKCRNPSLLKVPQKRLTQLVHRRLVSTMLLPENGVGFCFQWKDADCGGTMHGSLITDFPISPKLGIIIKRKLFHMLTLLYKPTTETYSSYIILRLESVQSLTLTWLQTLVQSSKVPAFEGCAFDRQFAEHSLSGVGRFANFFLIMMNKIAASVV